MAESKDSAARLVKVKTQLKEHISGMLGGERLKACYSCGACVGNCPVAKILDRFRPLRIILETKRGLEEELVKGEAIWDCAYCFICQDVCPQQVRFPDILFAIRNLAARKGKIPQGFMTFSRNVFDSGRSVALDEFMLEDREDLGLPQLESPIPRKALSDIRKIMKITGFKRLIKPK